MAYRLKIAYIIFVLLLLAFFLPSLALTKEHLLPGTLTAKELRKQFIDQTVETESADGKKQELLYFSPNGELIKVVKDRLSKGDWKVRKKGRLCTKVGSGKWQCRAVAKAGDEFVQYVVKKDGKHRHELTYTAFHSGKKLKELNKSPLLPQGTLGSKRLKKLFADRTVESVTAKKGRVSLTYYSPDGNVEQIRDGVMRTGKWRVKSKRICMQMDGLKEKCRIIVKEGGGYKKYIVKKNGRHQHSVSYRKFTPGRHL